MNHFPNGIRNRSRDGEFIDKEGTFTISGEGNFFHRFMPLISRIGSLEISFSERKTQMVEPLGCNRIVTYKFQWENQRTSIVSDDMVAGVKGNDVEVSFNSLKKQ